MADKKISELNQATALFDNDDFAVVQDSETKQLNAATLKAYTKDGLSKTDVGLDQVDNTADADKPISTAMQTALDAKQAVTAKNAANGYAGLDANAKLPTSLLPDLAISEYLGAVADQTARLALTGEKGDWCSQTDVGKVYVITGDTPSETASWTALTYPVTPGITLNGTAIAPGDTATITAATTNTLTIGTGLTGTSFNGSSATTVAIDSSVVTLTGTQTLTNKTFGQVNSLGAVIAAGAGQFGDDVDITGDLTLTGAVNGTTIPSNKTLLVSTDIGSSVQAYDADLAAFASKTAPTGAVVGTTDTQTLTNKTLTDTSNAIYASAGPSNTQLAGLRNKIINGDFKIWQRGTSFTSSSVNEYSADRFRTEGWGVNSVISRQTFTAGQTDVPGAPEYFCRVQVSSAPSGYWAFQQRIECPFVIGKGTATYTLSFWVKSVSGTIAANTFTFGFGGFPTANNPTITTTWQKLTVTSSVAPTGNQSVYLVNIGSSISSIAIDIANVQVEPGSVATPFEQRHIGTELALCQRYYYRTSTGSNSPLGYAVATSTTTARGFVQAPNVMQATITSLEQSGTATDYRLITSGGPIVCSSVPIFVATSPNNGVEVTFTVASGLTAGNACILDTVNVNGTIGMSAEL